MGGDGKREEKCWLVMEWRIRTFDHLRLELFNICESKERRKNRHKTARQLSAAWSDSIPPLRQRPLIFFSTGPDRNKYIQGKGIEKKRRETKNWQSTLVQYSHRAASLIPSRYSPKIKWRRMRQVVEDHPGVGVITETARRIRPYRVPPWHC